MATANLTSTSDLAPQYIREALAYDPETGLLTWLERPDHHFRAPWRAKRWNKQHAGATTGRALDGRGYRVVVIDRKSHRAHRIIWLLLYGTLPAQIDHVNGDPSDNRLTNLRACSREENQHNQGLRKSNKSGYKGVSWLKDAGCWRATIYINSKQRHLGCFDDPSEAYLAYCAAARELHGEFANIGASQCRGRP